MQGKFQDLVDNLSRLPMVPASVATTTCPRSAQQVIPKLLDMGVPAKVLTQALAEAFGYPVYSKERHGEFEYVCSRRLWAYASGILFVACPFDDSLQPAVLLPPGAYGGFSGFGLLPVSGDQSDTGARKYDRAQAEKVIRGWLERGVECNASDLHIAPLTTKYIRIRMRVDGELRTLDEVPASSEETNYRFISNLLLKMMNCESGSFIRPVDGRFEYQGSKRRIEVRATMRPVNIQGMTSQAFYLRLLGMHGADSLKSFSRLGFSSEIQAVFADVRRLNQGLVLITGPTGSGKSTTLYANLARIVNDTPGRSVQTLEDPVELDIRGIDQTQVNEAVGTGFQEGLRSLMRSDVDVILVGEIRDPETANLAVRASLTGHLVLATVHARDALSAIERMVDLGVNTKALALVLSAVFAQRLMRRVCSACSSELMFSQCGQGERYADLFLPEDVLKQANPAGCVSCDQGYRGRRVVIEHVCVSRRLSQAITFGEDIASFQKIAASEGGETLWQNAASLARRGEVTLDECIKHLPFRWRNDWKDDGWPAQIPGETAPVAAHNHV